MENDQPEQLKPIVELTPAEKKNQDLKILVFNLRNAKDKEESAKTNRIAIEEMLAVQIPGPEVGQKTETLPDGSKIVVTRGLNYKADLDGIRDVIAECNDRGMGIIVPTQSSTTHKLDIAGYEWYKETHPQIFTEMAQHVTVTPRKVSVVLKPAKE